MILAIRTFDPPKLFNKYNKSKVITGFNTDIIFDGITYHVQTEDKGLDTPLILSLIYDGGTILASKRAPYDDLLEGDFDEKALAERLQRQHKLICAAVKAGRIEDLKRMTRKDSAEHKLVKKETVEVVEPDKPDEQTGFETFVIPKELLEDLPFLREENKSEDDFATKIEETNPAPPRIFNENSPIEIPRTPVIKPKKAPSIVDAPSLLAFKEQIVFVDKSEEIFSEVADPFVRETGKIPKPDDGLIFEVPKIISEPVVEEVKIVEEEMILPDEAVIIVSENINQPETAENKLSITLLNDSEFKGGDRKTLNISVHRGNRNSGLAKAHVIIKVLGSTFRPIIFHAKTDANGLAVIHMQFPNFKNGRAVLLIRALHEGEESEIRRVIAQG